jgi:hypothetical protein
MSQVNDVKSQLSSLGDALDVLATYLESYSADVVPQVDTLITTFKEKGAERAKDILLEARFSDFFGLTMDGMSYSGDVQAKLKEINREDLPVRKDNRTGKYKGGGELLAQIDDKDFEYDTSDIDTSEDIDIPTGTVY